MFGAPVGHDPGMSDSMKDAWNEVAEQFEALGKLIKGRYQAAASAEADSPAATAAQDAAQDASAALREAFDRFVEAGRDLGDRATGVVRDEEVKAEAKRAAGTLNDALAATVDLISEQVGTLFRRKAAPDAPGTLTEPPSPLPEPEPPSDPQP